MYQTFLTVLVKVNFQITLLKAKWMSITSEHQSQTKSSVSFSADNFSILLNP